MRVEYPGQGPFAGENDVRLLQLSAEAPYSGWELRVAFLTPAGKRCVSPPVTLENGEGSYPLPAAVLDAPGRLLTQLIAEDDTGRVMKSEITPVYVEKGLGGAVPETDGGAVITLGGVKRALTALEAAFGAHTHDGRYYTAAQTDALLLQKQDLLAFDEAPTAGSGNVLTSGAVKTALDAIVAPENYVSPADLAAVATSGAYGDLQNKPTIPAISTSIVTDKASDEKTVSPKAVYEYAAKDSDYAYINGDHFAIGEGGDCEYGLPARVSADQTEIHCLLVTEKSMKDVTALNVSSANAGVCKADGTSLYLNAGKGVTGWTATATKYSANKILLVFKLSSGTINAAAGEAVTLEYPEISIGMTTA
jgi:hypothetical protein